MLLSREDADLFYRLYGELLLFVNRRLQVLETQPADPDEFWDGYPAELRVKLRDALFEHLELLDAFVAENPAGLAEVDLEIVRGWNHRVSGTFFVLRQLKKHMIFLGDDNLPFGVVGLTKPIEHVVGGNIPSYVNAVLLPFKGKIVYDGFMIAENLIMGPGMRRAANDWYRDGKARHGIVTSLPRFDAEPVKESSQLEGARPRQTKKTKKTKKGASTSRQQVAERKAEVVALLEAFCRQHLNDEFVELGQRMAAAVARKEPAALRRSSPKAWAAGIMRVLRAANTLHVKVDPIAQLRAPEIDRFFGVSAGTATARAAEIRTLLGIQRTDTKWLAPCVAEANPLVMMGDTLRNLVQAGNRRRSR